MAYTSNPHMPKVRKDAVTLVKQEHWSMRKVALRYGVQPSTISRWGTFNIEVQHFEDFD